MLEKTCNTCGQAVNSKDVVIHRMIPEGVARQAGIYDFSTAVLCPNCSNEVQAWYEKRVYGVSYDNSTKHFLPRSPAGIVKEYEAVYRAFEAYKNKRHAKR